MAARRSRLQIKPNIGGPKPPARPAQSKQKTQSEAAISTKPDVDNTRTLDVAANVGNDNSEKVKSIDDLQHTTTEDKSIDKNESPTAGMTRGRLRRFDKTVASPPAPGKTSIDSGEKKISPYTKQKTVEDNEQKGKNTSDDATLEGSKNDSAASKGIVPKTSATQMPRRSRFPKARPNVADAARRKQK